jgi:hypothetical protein
MPAELILDGRYSVSVFDLAAVDAVTAPEFYALQAKVCFISEAKSIHVSLTMIQSLLQNTVNLPSVERLTALVLVATIEHQAGRTDGMKLSIYMQQS